MTPARIGLHRRLRAYADPLAHALIAAAVAAPLVPRGGRAPLLAAVAAAELIDLDHPVAARSRHLADWISMPVRPPSHSLVVALGAGAVTAAVAGPVPGWAAFAGLASHLLHDAGDRAAPTPLLWPLAPPRQIGRRRQLAGTAALVLGSVAVSRAAGAARRPWAAGARGAVAAARPRTT
jgi:hypothetical protein